MRNLDVPFRSKLVQELRADVLPRLLGAVSIDICPKKLVEPLVSLP